MASCLDDENEIPLKVIALFSASRFALPSIPLIFHHSLVTSVFWPTKSLHAVLDVKIQSWQFRRGVISITAVIIIIIVVYSGVRLELPIYIQE